MLPIYEFDLNDYFYDCPSGEIDLIEFNKEIFNRANILLQIECINKLGLKKFKAEWMGKVFKRFELLKDNKLLELVKSNGESKCTEYRELRRLDHLTVFILQLICSRHKDLQQWFNKLELDLFVMRYMQLSDKALDRFFKVIYFEYKPISKERKDELKEDLIGSTTGEYDFDQTEFYEIPFVMVIDLIKLRKVFVHAGFAYVPRFRLASYFSVLYNNHLKAVTKIAEQTRLSFFKDERFRALAKMFDEQFRTSSADQLIQANFTLRKLNYNANIHFPLCMQQVHNSLLRDHHLKYGGRLQYLRFLKAIGIKYEDADLFFKTEFTKLIPDVQYDKQYSYFVKHVYGLVGSQIQYAPHTCDEIVNGSNQLVCPFNNPNLQQILKDTGMNIDAVNDVVDNQKRSCQLACNKYYQYTHNDKYTPEVFIRPVDYYTQSFAATDRNRCNSSSSESDSDTYTDVKEASNSNEKKKDLKDEKKLDPASAT